MIIRSARPDDVDQLMDLYMNHLTSYPPQEVQVRSLWQERIRDLVKRQDYHLLVGEVEGVLVASLTLVIIPNLTHNLRPYSVMENVVTHRDYRNLGYASGLISHARTIAQEAKCYKIMLMTGSKRESTLNFYRKNGFTIGEKTACLSRL